MHRHQVYVKEFFISFSILVQSTLLRLNSLPWVINYCLISEIIAIISHYLITIFLMNYFFPFGILGASNNSQILLLTFCSKITAGHTLGYIYGHWNQTRVDLLSVKVALTSILYPIWTREVSIFHIQTYITLLKSS